MGVLPRVAVVLPARTEWAAAGATSVNQYLFVIAGNVHGQNNMADLATIPDLLSRHSAQLSKMVSASVAAKHAARPC